MILSACHDRSENCSILGIRGYVGDSSPKYRVTQQLRTLVSALVLKQEYTCIIYIKIEINSFPQTTIQSTPAKLLAARSSATFLSPDMDDVDDLITFRTFFATRQ